VEAHQAGTNDDHASHDDRPSHDDDRLADDDVQSADDDRQADPATAADDDRDRTDPVRRAAARRRKPLWTTPGEWFITGLMRQLQGALGRRSFAVVAAATLALVIGSASYGSSAAPTRAGNASFSDPQGDASNGGIDITTVSVSNDAAGNVSFRVDTPNTGQLAQGAYLVISIDGNKDGTDDYHIVFRGGTTPYLYKENPSTFVQDLSNASFSNGASITIGRKTIGLDAASSFQFAVFASNDAATTDDDDAPDSGWWTYTFTSGVTSVTVPLDSLHFSPAQLQAGKTTVLKFKALTNTGAPLPSGTVICTAKFGGRKIHGAGHVKAGVGTCKYYVPLSAAGKTFAAHGTVSYPGATGWQFTTSAFVPGAKTLRAGKVSTTAAPPAPYQNHGPYAGAGFFVGIGILVHQAGVSSDVRIQHGVAICRATVGGSALRPLLHHVARGSGTQCGWIVPDTARGRILDVTIGARLGHASAQRRLKFLVH
jgi:hypothetical protein